MDKRKKAIADLMKPLFQIGLAYKHMRDKDEKRNAKRRSNF